MNIIRHVFVCLSVGLFFTLSIAIAQQKKINLQINKGSVEHIFKELKKQTGLEFVYTQQQAKQLNPVSVSVKNATIEQVLQQILTDSPFSYKISKGVVILVETKKRNDTSVPKRTIQGKITDDDSKGLSRISIKTSNGNESTVTNEMGLFTLQIQENEVLLEISSVGYTTQKINIQGKATLNVQLKKANNELDEALVVAYGTSTKREQTGAISVVTAKEIQDIPSASIGNLLQGRVAGMDVTNMSGSPGSGGTAIVVRGYNSLDVEQERRYSSPLWVVDGVPMNSFTSPITGTNLLSDLNPDMIESIQVLKDASSAAIYGSRAANGVILVTTKKGKKGQKATFAFNGSQTLAILPKLPTITLGSAERWLRIEALRNSRQVYLDRSDWSYNFPETPKEVYEKGGTLDMYWMPRPADITSNGGGIYQDSLNNFFNNSTNYFPLFFEPARVTNANFQSYGGTEFINYGVGLGYYNEAGILKGTGFNRIDFNTRLNAQPVPRASVDAQINISTGTRKRGTPSQVSSLKAAPLVETIPGDPLFLSSLYPGEESSVWAEIREKQEGTKENNRSLRLRGSLRLGYDIMDGLNFSTSGSLDYSLERRNFFTPSYLDQTLKNRNSTLGEQGINLMALNENLLTYTKSINDHNVNILLGQSYQYEQNEYNGGSAMNTPSDLVWYASTLLPQYTKDIAGTTETIVPLQRYMSDMWEKGLLSFFARAEYNYKKRYLVSAAIRKDGSSVFGDNNKWGTFPSIGTGYNFAEDINWKPLNFGKIRASWGRSGLQFYSPYLALGTFTPGSAFQGTGTLAPNVFYNQSLSWEQTDQYDFGLDLDFFNSRLSIVTDYYYRYTDKLLDKVPLAFGYNMYRNQWRNAGAISNEGLELLVKYEAIRKDDFYWKITFNAARNWNKFVKSYGNYAEAISNSGVNIGRVVGKPLNGILVNKTNGFYQTQNEVPIYYNYAGDASYFGIANGSYTYGDWKIIDADGDGSRSEGDYVYGGSALPTLYGGLGNELRYKNFDFNFLFTYQFGRHILNMLPGNSLVTDPTARLEHPLLLDLNDVRFWTPERQDANYPINVLELDYYKASFTAPVDQYLQKVNWIKLKTIVAGYNFKFKKGSPEQLRLFASAENLFTITNYKGIDPEVVDLASGKDQGTSYPLARKITLGLTLKF